jgi:cell division protein FtsZ
MMGTGEASGEDRALMAAQNAIQNPLLDEVSLRGAKAVLVNVTGGPDMTLLEVDEAANAISSEVDPEGNIIFGAAFDPSLEGKIRVSVVATGMDAGAQAAIEPKAAAPEVQRAPIIQARPVQPAPQSAAAATPAPTLPLVEPARPEPAVVQPQVQPQPAIAAEAPRTIRIVDPAAAEDGDELYIVPPREPQIEQPRIYSRPAATEVRRPTPSTPLPDPRIAPEPKRGLMSLFGGRRQDAPHQPHPPQRSSNGGAQPAVFSEPEAAEAHEDLEIPSFLRRLAN